MVHSKGTVTRLLRKVSEGQSGALDELLPIVYSELRRRAEGQMHRERRGHTLQPTALVHEAYLRLIGQEGADWKDRNHFYAVASQAMRRVLVDHARARQAQKRGGDLRRVPLVDHVLETGREEIDLVELDDALKELESYGERLARVVEMRFFGGLSVEQVAGVLQVDSRTVERDWRTAKTILYDLLGGEQG
ncbi:MAG: sigma-70 family RNA polymerase sigma factor [Planctomycetota bacterium]|nr:sigma-70 family RNA polymerase sigma factor [Planctomycetota bacterium]